MFMKVLIVVEQLSNDTIGTLMYPAILDIKVTSDMTKDDIESKIDLAISSVTQRVDGYNVRVLRQN